jgi:hypothetical protein
MYLGEGRKTRVPEAAAGGFQPGLPQEKKKVYSDGRIVSL